MIYREKIQVGTQYYLEVTDWLGKSVESLDGYTTCPTKEEAEELMRLIHEDHPDYHITVVEEPIYEVHIRI